MKKTKKTADWETRCGVSCLGEETWRHLRSEIKQHNDKTTCVSSGLAWTVNVSLTYPWALLQFGHHDDVSAALLPDHPPEIAEGLGQRALSGDVCVLLSVAVDVVGVDVVAPWNACVGKDEVSRLAKFSQISTGIESWFRFPFICGSISMSRLISWLLPLKWRVNEGALIKWQCGTFNWICLSFYPFIDAFLSLSTTFLFLLSRELQGGKV